MHCPRSVGAHVWWLAFLGSLPSSTWWEASPGAGSWVFLPVFHRPHPGLVPDTKACTVESQHAGVHYEMQRRRVLTTRLPIPPVSRHPGAAWEGNHGCMTEKSQHMERESRSGMFVIFVHRDPLWQPSVTSSGTPRKQSQPPQTETGLGSALEDTLLCLMRLKGIFWSVVRDFRE